MEDSASAMEGVSLALLDCSTPFSSRHHAIGFAFLCKVSQSLRLTKHRRAIYEDFCRQPSHLSMILVENGYSIKNHGKLSGMPFYGTGFLGIEKRKPDGDGTPRNKKNVVLQELARKKKSSSPLALEVDKFKNKRSIWKQ